VVSGNEIDSTTDSYNQLKSGVSCPTLSSTSLVILSASTPTPELAAPCLHIGLDVARGGQNGLPCVRIWSSVRISASLTSRPAQPALHSVLAAGSTATGVEMSAPK